MRKALKILGLISLNLILSSFVIIYLVGNEDTNLRTALIFQDSKIEGLSDRNYVQFSPSSKGYAVLRNSTDDFYISLVDIKKYADGYKANFLIGNPEYVTFYNLNADLEWGAAFDSKHYNEPNHSRNDWVKSLKNESVVIDKPIYPGTWTNVTFVLPDTTSKQTGVIRLYLTPTVVDFNKNNI